MVTSDQLLQLLTHLQSSGDRIYTRNMLLKYIRKHSKAQVVVLFVLDREQQVLIPLAYNGKLPDLPSTSSRLSNKQRMQQTLPLDGLFASILLAQNLLYIPDVERDSRVLSQEQNWSYARGSLLLNMIKGGDQLQGEHGKQRQLGVLALCFSAEMQNVQSPESIPPTVNVGDLQICSHLLSACLSQEKPLDAVSPRVTRAKQTARRKEQERETVELLQKAPIERQGTFPELMYSLSTLADLYEIGLVLTENVEVHELHQHVLSSLARVIHTPCACLLLYHPSLRRLLPAARMGDELSCAALVNSIDGIEMERLSMRGPGEVLSSVMSGEQHILLVTLSCNCVLLGVVALVLNAENPLPDERGLLLTYMGNVAALLLRNYSVHTRELQMAVEHERTRIAHDIHDGAAQQIGHVLHKLEFIQRMIEKQALWPHLLQTALIEVERAASILEAGLTDLRHSISALLPVQLDGQDFISALQSLLDEHMLNDPGLEITYNIDDPEALPAALEAPIFRFIQEALTNVHKHALATRVEIYVKTAANALVVEVGDNGIGFQETVPVQRIGLSEEQEVQHLGMRTMHERLREVGGNLEIQSKANEGTIVRARFLLANSVQLLTSREHEVLRLIVDGLTNRDIAQKLSISLETVKSHVHHIMQKMQVKDRTQAAVLATRQGWL